MSKQSLVNDVSMFYFTHINVSRLGLLLKSRLLLTMVEVSMILITVILTFSRASVAFL